MGIFSFLFKKNVADRATSITHVNSDGSEHTGIPKPKSDYFPGTIQEAYIGIFFVCLFIDGTNENKTAKFFEITQKMSIFQYEDVDLDELLGQMKAINIIYKFKGIIIGSCNRIGDDYKDQAYLDACEIMYADNEFTKPKKEIFELLTLMLDVNPEYSVDVIEDIKHRVK